MATRITGYTRPEPEPEYMTGEAFAAKIEWEGGIVGALEYGLKHTDLDPDEESVAELRAAWAELEELYIDQVSPLLRRVDDALEPFEKDEDDEGPQ